MLDDPERKAFAPGGPLGPPGRREKIIGALAWLALLPARPFLALAGWLKSRQAPKKPKGDDNLLVEKLSKMFFESQQPDDFTATFLKIRDDTKPGRMAVMKGESVEEATRRTVKTAIADYENRQKRVTRHAADCLLEDYDDNCYDQHRFIESIVMSQLAAHRTDAPSPPIMTPPDPMLKVAKEARLRELLARSDLTKEEKAQLDELTNDGVVVLD
jgi:hypothetical protein